MAAKKKPAAPARAKRRAQPKQQAQAKRAAQSRTHDETSAAHTMLTMLATHESTIRELAEVVVNLHANVRALRDVIEPLASMTTDERVARPLGALLRVTLDE